MQLLSHRKGIFISVGRVGRWRIDWTDSVDLEIASFFSLGARDSLKLGMRFPKAKQRGHLLEYHGEVPVTSV